MSQLLEQVRSRIGMLHYSIRTEEAYLKWIREFIIFNGKRHPGELGAVEISSFLSHLARERNIAASTQNQALSALLFLFFIHALVELKNCENSGDTISGTPAFSALSQ